MRADTSLRTAGGTDPAGDGPDPDGRWPGMTRTALAAGDLPVHGQVGQDGKAGQVGWRVDVEGFWSTARPTPGELPDEGWKLHVSAASTVGGAVLAAVTEVLAEDPCAFRFATGPAQLHEINSRHSDQGSAGKFITVYPVGEPQFRRLAAALHRATDGLPGPAVLSDRPYRPGSLVHYRYGAIAARAELGNDGGYRSMLRGPDGERVEDVRGASYRIPPWARDPLAVDGQRTFDGPRASPGPAPLGPTPPGAPGAAGSPGSGYRPGVGRPAPRRRGSGGVLLAGRYVVTGAIRHGAKGGVFLGRDTDGGAEVVVKQARAHIEMDPAGTDARAALRHEAALLARLEGLGLAPRPVELVEQDDSLFLVQERIAGQPLGSWVAARLRRDGSPDVDWAEAGPMAHILLDLVERVHEQGLVLRDLSPGHVLVQPDGSLRLVDLELAAEAGSRAGSAGVPGYRAPEQGPGRLALVTAAGAPVAARRGGGFAGLTAGRGGDGTRTAEPEADLYALGGLFFLLATGHDPLLPEDLPHARPVTDRLGRWLALAARCGTTARRLAPAVLGLRAEDPRHRWHPTLVRESLASDGHTPVRADRPSGPDRPAPDAHRPAPVRDPERLDGPGPSGVDRSGGTDPGGAFWHTDPAAPPDRPGPEAAAATRLDGQGQGQGHGRAHGHSDTAVLDRVLHDGLRHIAATATPSRRDRLWPVVPAGERADPCNVQHGAAGVLAVLARAAATTGLPEDVRAGARATARTAADWIERRCAAEPVVLPGLHFGRSGAAWALLDAARALDDRALARRAAELAARIAVEWPNPDVCHGAAGAGFLQLRCAAEDLPGSPTAEGTAGAAEFLARASRCGHGLLAAARQAPYGAVWPVPQDFDSALAGITHLGFAHGVAGVGAFLLAAAEATGDGALLAGAVEAGRTLAATARLDPPAAPGPAGDGTSPAAWWPRSADDPTHVRLTHWCNGSSGAGTFLLRLWRATGDADAHRLAVAAGRAVTAGRWHSGVCACHGLAGDGEFLLDLAEATGDPGFRSAAVESGLLIAARPALRDGLLVLPDETGTGCAPAYGTGTAGALAFLLRLRHGGPRLWVDPVPFDTPPGTPSGTSLGTASGRTGPDPAGRVDSWT
ncbi:class IV lanthionine synthetase LanL [Kitasatospora purpeofusca]|uniref:non-specific serine/threonine protein kinase n=1 Tax=Kitasatospora purpeofusca TaxID=67352 RepID=A0ABZ1U5R2_9ACTN|nr:class IV lanthionine synthetase LanL [Kitasatospora purpeofusca]